MLVLTSLLLSAIFTSLLDCNNCNTLGALINGNENNETLTVLANNKTSNLNKLEVEETSDRLGDVKNVQSTMVAILMKPLSRTCNCILKTNVSCGIRASNVNAEIIVPPDVLGKGSKDGRIVGIVSNSSNNIFDQRSTGRYNFSHLKIKEYNDTHFVSKIVWAFNEKTSIVDSIEVFLLSNATDDRSKQKSLLNLICSYQGDHNMKRESYILQFDCYIHNEYIKELFYKDKGLGVVVSTLKIVGQNSAFLQVADISLHEPAKQIINYHGFVSDPPSRAKLCQLRVNRNCGLIVYEPQSVEGFKGFPYSRYSPPDGKIASANNPNFDNLNEYGTDRWVRVEFPSVNCYNQTHVYFNLSWYFTATHSSDDIRVYVSNEKYTSTEPLSRHHLELEPLCTRELYGQRPPLQLTMTCPVSFERYRRLSELKELLLLSVWNINDTAFAFYQVIDLRALSTKQSYKNIWNKCRH